MNITLADILNQRMHFNAFTWRNNPTNPIILSTKNVTQEYDNNTQDYVVITSLVASAWLAAAYGNSPIGTPLLRVPDPSPVAATGNQLPALQLLDVQFNISSGRYVGKDPQNWANLFGTPERPHKLDSAIILPPGSKTKWEILPSLPATCQVHAQIVGFGYYASESQLVDMLNRQFSGV